MIKQFKCCETQALFEEKRTPRLANIAIVAIRKLQMLTPYHGGFPVKYGHRPSFVIFLSASQISLVAASSLGKWPRVLMILRIYIAIYCD